MAKIKVNTAGVTALRQNTLTMKSKADDCVQVISYVRKNIDMNTASTENIRAKLQSLQKRMQAQEDKLAKYAAFLTKVNDDFAAADRKIANQSKTVRYLMDQIISRSPLFRTRETLDLSEGFASYVALAGLFAVPAANTLALSVPVGRLADLLKDIFGKDKKPQPTPVSIPYPKADVDKEEPQPAPVSNPYTKADKDKKVDDIKNYDQYQTSHQCVSYVRDRMKHKLNIDTNDTWGYGNGKDVAKKWLDWINNTKKGRKQNEDGTYYRIADTTDDSGRQYKIEAYTDDDGSNIQADSFVCFGKTKGNKYGHVLYVESVQMEGNTKYVYYSEGGGNYYGKTDGILKRQTYDKFMEMDGGYTGCVTFTEIKK